MMPDAIKQIPWKVFFLGLIWAGVAGALPAAVLLRHWLVNWSGERIDWSSVYEVAGTGALMGAGGYWRKYAALLQLPPEFQQARDLVAGVQKTEVTTQTVERQENPPATITTTKTEVKETHIEAGPVAGDAPKP